MRMRTPAYLAPCCEACLPCHLDPASFPETSHLRLSIPYWQVALTASRKRVGGAAAIGLGFGAALCQQ